GQTALPLSMNPVKDQCWRLWELLLCFNKTISCMPKLFPIVFRYGQLIGNGQEALLTMKTIMAQSRVIYLNNFSDVFVYYCKVGMALAIYTWMVLLTIIEESIHHHHHRQHWAKFTNGLTGKAFESNLHPQGTHLPEPNCSHKLKLWIFRCVLQR